MEASLPIYRMDGNVVTNASPPGKGGRPLRAGGYLQLDKDADVFVGGSLCDKTKRKWYYCPLFLKSPAFCPENECNDPHAQNIR
jgi:hypothetical protein